MTVWFLYCTLIHVSDFVCVCVCVCTGSTYIACDWDAEVKEKCYDEEAIKVKLKLPYSSKLPQGDNLCYFYQGGCLCTCIIQQFTANQLLTKYIASHICCVV